MYDDYTQITIPPITSCAKRSRVAWRGTRKSFSLFFCCVKCYSKVSCVGFLKILVFFSGKPQATLSLPCRSNTVWLLGVFCNFLLWSGIRFRNIFILFIYLFNKHLILLLFKYSFLPFRFRNNFRRLTFNSHYSASGSHYAVCWWKWRVALSQSHVMLGWEDALVLWQGFRIKADISVSRIVMIWPLD